MTRPLPLLLLLVAMVCASTAGAPPDTDVAAVAGGITAFSSDLYAKLSERPGNLFCSPFSISTALAMTYAGARGATAEQMARVLHFGLGQDALHPASGALAARLTGGDLPGCELSVANRIWAQPSTGLLPAFLEATRRHYRAEVARADFSARTEAARTEINRWVEKQTKDRIKDLIAKGLLSRDTRMVLVNAIYFKGRWAVQFEKDSTRDAPFTIGDGQAVSAPMMHRSGELRYVEDEQMQGLELPYEGGDLSMVVLLPKKADGLGDLGRSIAAGALTRWLGALRTREVEVYLPRFKMTSEFELSAALAAMGMPDAFTAVADFSGMAGTRDLFISAVIHKAFVDVNEEGTEAAAATAVVMVKAMRPSAPPVVFRADHPFVFLIRDNRTGAVLFIGRVVRPSEG